MAARRWNPAHHPRDKNGRFTRSATKVMTAAEKKRAAKTLDGFQPVKHTDRQDGRAYLTSIQSPKSPAVQGYFDGDWKQTNAALRAGKSPDGVDEIDAAMRPLPDDVVLRRQIPAAVFGQVPFEELPGLKLRDAAYASTTLDTPGMHSKPGSVVMHIATTAGTPAVVNPDDGEILLARDTEIAISRVAQNNQGGWDVYGTVLPKAPARKPKPAPKRPATSRTPKTGKGDGAPPAAVEPAAQTQVSADDRLDEIATQANADVAGFEARAALTPKSPIDLHLQQVGISQGFDAAPRVGTKAELDAAVKSGWAETWRGVVSSGSGVTAAEINTQLRTGVYEPGRGYYGNGYYTTARRLTAENFRGSEPKTNQPAGGGSDFELSDLEPVDEPDSLLRVAIDPAAKTADFDALVAEQKRWIASQPTGSPAAKVFADVGRYAAGRGIDVITVSGEHPDGGYYPGWEDAEDDLAGAVQYVVLNRSVMLIQRAEDQP